MIRFQLRRSEIRRVLFFSFHYPPDQSAGAVRTRALVHALVQQDPSTQVTVFCSVPRRYGLNIGNSSSNASEESSVRIHRFWIPYFGNSPFASVVSYAFFVLQVIPAAIFLRPNIVVGTSAKLLTSFVAACAARITRADLYIDFRDTFADNFFYFYRWRKRILLQSVIMAIENLVLRSARSVNIVSVGFKDAFTGWEPVLSKYSISLTNYPNGIQRAFRNRIEEAVDRRSNDSAFYRVAYVGNLGEGQDIVGLLNDLASKPDLLQRMREERIRIDIFGSGAQVNDLKSLTSQGDSTSIPGPLAQLVFYRGLLSRDEIKNIYANVDCLMLQLGLYSSLSMVIPTKIFEYASTPYPIVYGASGFTSSFIRQISGTIKFEQCDAESFLDAVISSRSVKVSKEKRKSFLDCYDASSIYVAYARHILGFRSNK